jgi:predicted transcriptional regulator
MTEYANLLLIATTRIVTAWLGSQEVALSMLPELIREVHLGLAGMEPDRPAAPRMKPAVVPRRHAQDSAAVDVRKSVFADHLICLEDGKSFKTLARHLNETHGMTPAQYRTKWDLPATYPMMAPDYSKERSRLSAMIGLGKR